MTKKTALASALRHRENCRAALKDAMVAFNKARAEVERREKILMESEA